MKVLQITSSVNSGSVGRIAEDIGRVLISNGHESVIAYGRGNQHSESKIIKIGSKFDLIWHGFLTVVFDRHGYGSKNATFKLINEIEREKPDAIGLHNLHGYFINIDILFAYLNRSKIPVLWTLYDCWSFTGHCCYFDDISCVKWKLQCEVCPKTKKYPASYFFDNSESNYLNKKVIFNSVKNIHIVVHSEWLEKLVATSFLSGLKRTRIFSGVDLQKFSPKNNLEVVSNKYKLSAKKIVLGVASVWDSRKGLNDFIQLKELIDRKVRIVLVGLSNKQIASLPKGVIGIKRTENVNELAMLYSLADVFVNPTSLDNFPTTNIEALACGTPVITYNTGGSAESIDSDTGIVVEKGDILGLHNAIKMVFKKDKEFYSEKCCKRAMTFFDKNERYNDYLDLYLRLIENSKNERNSNN